MRLPKLKLPRFPRVQLQQNSKYRRQPSFLSTLFSQSIRNKFLFTIFVLVIYRVLTAIPLPGINMTVYQQQFGSSSSSEISYFLTVFTGGSLETPSIVGLGIGVYITASIVIQLFSTIIPRLEELTKEGNRGKQVIDQYTRYLTVPLSFVYSIGYLFLMTQNTNGDLSNPLGNLIPRTADGNFSPTKIIFMALILTAGSMLMMWLAELITENGIGNGSSILIMAGILSSLPTFVSKDFAGLNLGESIRQILAGNTQYLSDPSMIAVYLLVIGTVLLVLGVVFMNESTRKIIIQYARRERAGGATESVLPLKLNQSGVLPIIFASALLSFPQVLVPIIERIVDPTSAVGQFITSLRNSFLFTSDPITGASKITSTYLIVYFVLIIVLSLMYATIALKPDDVAENLQKSGAFIPGIRPGKTTENYITVVLLRLTFAGSLFLGLIALIPLIAGSVLQHLSGYQFTLFSAIGGTSVLIVVGVILDTVRQLRSLQATQSYDRYI